MAIIGVSQTFAKQHEKLAAGNGAKRRLVSNEVAYVDSLPASGKIPSRQAAPLVRKKLGKNTQKAATLQAPPSAADSGHC